MAFKAMPKKAEADEPGEESDAKAKPSPFGSKIKALGIMMPADSDSSEDTSVFAEHAGDVADLMGVPAEKRSEFISALKGAIEACHDGGYDDEE